MKYPHCLFSSIFFISAISHSSPLSLWNNSIVFNDDKSLKIETSFDIINDEIDLFNFREKEGISDSSTGDYLGHKIILDYQLTSEWNINAGYWNREIMLSENDNKIKTTQLGLFYTPELGKSKNSSFKIGISYWTNEANTLIKSTPTQINNNEFSNVQVNSPKDRQFEFESIYSNKLDSMNIISLNSSLGYSQTKIDSIDLQTKYSGCLINIKIDQENNYSGNLAQRCKVDNITVNQLNIYGNAKDFGLDVQKDLNYESYYASLGGSWSWNYRKFESQLAYQYKYFWRKDIDDRISSFGSNPIKDNHTLGLKLSYELTPQIKTFIAGEMYKNNFVGHIPFLYNGVTASRMDKKYGIASFGVQFNLF